MLSTSQPELERLLGRTLCEQVPFNVAIIDRDFRILAANARFEEYFGDWQNQHCYEVYKGSCQRCARCQAELTFADGRVRVSDETGVDRHGRTCHYVVHLAPLRDDAGEVKYILEMTTDLTETRSWQREYDLFFERVPCLAFVIDRNLHIVRANEKFREIFGEPEGRFCFEVCKRRKSRCRDCGAALTFADGAEHVSSQVGVHRDGSPAYYVATSTPLGRGGDSVAHVIETAVDVTEVKKLEQEKLEVERLAAVGQTVAGLAHTIKNLLMGLEGGMYMVDTGLRRGDATRIANGWGVLQRNFEKTTALVKDFLNFAKGRLPELQPTDPVALARALVSLYAEAGRRQGVELVFEEAPNIPLAPLDPGAIEACLTNLLSNAIDAVTMCEKGGGRVVLRTKDEGDELVFEVADNGCGMDWDVKGRVFTTFFTTKGGKGTGLGLLTTRKIIQEHGGRIEVESTPGQGSTFRIHLPRKRLQAIAEKTAGAASREGVAQS